MAGEYQALELAALGGSMQGLLATLQNAEDGLMSGDDGILTDGSGLGRWPAASGLDADNLNALLSYVETRFLPLLRKAVARVPATPDAFSDTGAAYGSTRGF